MAEKIIAGGAWVQILVDLGAGQGLQPLGMANDAGYDEDWGIQAAKVLNYLGPISLDSQDYNCTLRLGTFVPEKALTLYADGGEITIEDLLPYRDDVQINGKSREFAQMVFQNTATNVPIRSFSGVVVASNGDQITPNAYVSSNVRLRARKRDKKI